MTQKADERIKLIREKIEENKKKIGENITKQNKIIGELEDLGVTKDEIIIAEKDYEKKEKPVNQMEGIAKETINKLFGLGSKNEEKINEIHKEVEILVTREEAEETLEETRNKYIAEYKKGKKETSRQALVGKTKNATFNILAGVKNLFNKNKKIDYKESTKKEDYISEEEKNAKMEYTKARIEMGNIMYAHRKAELEKEESLSEKEIEEALANYKATEIFAKTILEERQKVIEGKTGNPNLLKKLLNGYRKMGKWQKIAISIALSGVVLGTVGATAGISGAAIAGKLAHMTVKKVLASGVGGGISGYLAKGIDFTKRKSDAEFLKTQTAKKDILKEKFSRNEIGLEKYEEEIASIETAEYKRLRNRMLIKAGVGIAISGGVGFGLSYSGVLDHLDHIGGVHDVQGHNTIHSTKTGEVMRTKMKMPQQENVLGAKPLHYPDEIPKGAGGAFIPESKPAMDLSTEITAERGDGGIALAHKIKADLETKYHNVDPKDIPTGAQEAMKMTDGKFAEKLGLYKPNEINESVIVHQGDQIKFNENDGSIEAFNKNGEEIKLKGFDYDSYKLKHAEDLKNEVMFEAPKVLPDDEVLVGDYPNEHIVNPELNVESTEIINNVEHMKFDNPDHIIPIEHGKMKFIYDTNHNVIKVDIKRDLFSKADVGKETEEYFKKLKMDELSEADQLKAREDIEKLILNKKTLNNLEPTTQEYRFFERITEKSKIEITKKWEDVLKGRKLKLELEEIEGDKTKKLESIFGTRKHDLSPEEIIKVKTISAHNINHVFPTEEQMKTWVSLKNNDAKTLMDMSKDDVRDDLKPLFSYMKKLEKVTDMKPMEAGLNVPPESINDYINRAMKKVAENGKLDRVKIYK